MVKEYVEYLTFADVGEKHLYYKMQKHIALSDEHFLGLGIEPKNTRSWFEFVSKYVPLIDKPKESNYFSIAFYPIKDVYHNNR